LASLFTFHCAASLRDSSLTRHAHATPPTFIAVARLSPSRVGPLLHFVLGDSHQIVSVTLLAQPALTTILAIPLLGEALFPLQGIGGILALIGIYIVNRLGR